MPAAEIKVYTDVLVKELRGAVDGTFLSKVPAKDRYVSKDKNGDAKYLSMTEIGSAPKVLLNNENYPISVADRDDKEVVIALDKFDTENTSISDDEAKYIAYDKVKSVLEQHIDAINDDKHELSLFNISPETDQDATPIVATTGAAQDGIKLITYQDIIKLKSRFDNANIPVKDRVLVLASDHLNALLLEDQSFAHQYYNARTGEMFSYMGFEIHTSIQTPFYSKDDESRLAFGSTPTIGTHYRASVAFQASDIWKATGSTQVYRSESTSDPMYRRTVIGARHYFGCKPMADRSLGAIVSVTTS